jgi:hypothetical protein
MSVMTCQTYIKDNMKHIIFVKSNVISEWLNDKNYNQDVRVQDQGVKLHHLGMYE